MNANRKMDFDVLIHVSREAAFQLRNRLNAMKIPYKDIRVEIIGAKEEHCDEVLKILSELQKN